MLQTTTSTNTEPTSTEPSLYDRDFQLWLADTVAKLRSGNFQNIDIEHLVDEIEALGKRDQRELQSRLIVLLVHLLKRCYIDSPNDFHGWELTIREQRNELELLLTDSPSLRNTWESCFQTCWVKALQQVKTGYPETNLPDESPFGKEIQSMLAEAFWN